MPAKDAPPSGRNAQTPKSSRNARRAEEAAEFFAPPAGPESVFRALSAKLGGPGKLARALGCSRATSYNLLIGRQRWSAIYIQKALQLLGQKPIVKVGIRARGGYEMGAADWREIKPQAIVLEYDGAFLVKGNSMWPVVGDGQYVLYRNVEAAGLKAGDIVAVRLPSGEVVVKAWYPDKEQPGKVFLASLYRGPREFRDDLFQPFGTSTLKDLRKVVGVWFG